jgi:hypothetical protein
MYQPPANMILKAEGTALALEKLTGQKAYISYSPSGADLYFTKTQIKTITPIIRALIAKKPSKTDNINIHMVPILAPIILEKAAPYILGCLAVGFLLGKL